MGRRKFTDDEIAQVSQALVKYRGSAAAVIKALPHIKGLSKLNITDIKTKRVYTAISDKYFDHTFFKSSSSKLTTSDVEQICQLLIQTDGNVYRAYLMATHGDYIFSGRVTECKISSIRQKQVYADISDKYFSKKSFVGRKQTRSRRTIDEINKICEVLVEADGDVHKTQKIMLNAYNTNVSLVYIRSIKNKTNRKEISDMYFDEKRFAINDYHIFTPDEIMSIVESLIKNNGDVRTTTDDLIPTIPTLTYNYVESIKYKKIHSELITQIYPDFNYSQERRLYNRQQDTADIICRALEKCKGSISAATEMLKDQGISYSNVRYVRYAKYRHWLIDKYGDNEDFQITTKSRQYDDKYIHMICQSLVDNNGDVYKVVDELIDKVPRANYNYIYAIKSKRLHSFVSDDYFSITEFGDFGKRLIKAHTDEELHLICQKLVEHNGSVCDVYDELVDIIPNLNKSVIYKTRSGHSHRSISRQYFDTIKFSSETISYTDENVELICETLVKHNGSIKATEIELANILPNLTSVYISSIKNKHARNNISDKYFSKRSFTNSSIFSKYTDDDVILMCDALNKHNGSIKSAFEDLQELLPYITRNYISAIKHKNIRKVLVEKYLK